ncbi:MAG TPA: pilus assembly protein N-terminal domain-containing protein [Xanthobacteraceae bacterium]|nr:pilus assembly protein N-terminal domain-containing protein [Xanthobacteraceae bacterium]
MKCTGRRSKLAAALLASTLAFAMPAFASEALDVTVDQATVLKLPDTVATIVVGNPLIADVSLQSGGMLVVTGKGYGSTNVLVLDRHGRVLMERAVHVHGPDKGVVVVYRGPARETYSCQPNCEQRITLGDGAAYFNATMAQTSARNRQALGGEQARTQAQ